MIRLVLTGSSSILLVSALVLFGAAWACESLAEAVQ